VVRPDRATIVEKSDALTKRLDPATFCRRMGTDKSKREISGLVRKQRQV
jgi:hypothetical protein